MDNEALGYLLALKKVNEALLTGLKAAVFVLEKEEHLPKERRKSMINQLKGLIEQGEKAFESVPSQH